MKKLIIFFFVGMLVPALFAGNNSGTQGMQFLNLGSDARGNALAGSVAADVRGADSIYWNPAGLSSSDERDILATYFPWPGDMSYAYLAFSMPMISKKIGMLGVSITFLNEGSLDQTVSDLKKLKNTESYDLAMSAAYALKLGPVSTGVALRYISQKLMGFSSSGVVLDVGSQIEILPVKGLKAGVVVKNVGFSEAYNIASMPLVVQLGTSCKWEIKNNAVAAMLSTDIGNDKFVNIGLEYGFRKTLFLRAGYKYELGGSVLAFPKGVSAGVGGFIATSGIKGMSADITWVPVGDLGTSLQTTLQFKF